MRRLILFRHGKAEIAGLTGGDRERPLAERGRAESALTAQWLLMAGFQPDVVYVSSSVRTRGTWDSARLSFPLARVQMVDSLYLAGVEAILELLQQVPEEASTVMVVGHNPGLQELGAQLAVEAAAAPVQISRIAEGFPTATACVFAMNGLEAAALEAIFEPPARAGGEPRWAYNAGGGD